MSRERRDPLEKSRFMEGNRQKWALIFILLAVGIFICDIIFNNIDPSPYMNFLLAIGTTFIVGASGEAIVKINSAKKLKEVKIQEESKRLEMDKVDESKPDSSAIVNAQAMYAQDPSYAPQGWVEEQTTEGEFR